MDFFRNKSAAKQAIPTRSNKPRSTKWHRMYFFLAGFDVLVVVPVSYTHLTLPTNREV